MKHASDQELQRVDEQLAAAASALAEYEHAVAGRAQLAQGLAAVEQRVQHLTTELARERDDVVQLTSGVRGFLYALLGDEQLSIEQREALEAEARLAEALGSRDHLAASLASIDARLVGQSRQALVDAAVAARAAKEEVLIRTHHPAGVALEDLSVRIEALNIELIPLDDAVAAGEAALAKVQAVIETLDRARDERIEQRDARGSAGEAEAAIAVFHRAIDGLSTAEDETLGFSTLVAPEERAPFVDAWIRALVGSGDRMARLAAARAAMAERRTRIEGKLARVRARRDELAPRRGSLLSERQRLLG